MTLVIDRIYALQARSHLTRFKATNTYSFVFACPFCGDNAKKRGTAGNLYRHQSGSCMVFHCYRCNISLSMRGFLEKINPVLAQEHRRECRTEWFETDKRPDYTEERKAPPPSPALFAQTFLRDLA